MVGASVTRVTLLVTNTMFCAIAIRQTRVYASRIKVSVLVANTMFYIVTSS